MTCESLFYLKHIAVYKLSFNVKDSNNTHIFAIKKFSFLLFPSLFPSSKVFNEHHSSYCVTHLHMTFLLHVLFNALHYLSIVILKYIVGRSINCQEIVEDMS